MKTAEEYCPEFEYLLDAGDNRNIEDAIKLIKKIQIDALKRAYKMIMDDTITYPGTDIKDLIEELENETI